jgi:hypothetical protein
MFKISPWVSVAFNTGYVNLLTLNLAMYIRSLTAESENVKLATNQIVTIVLSFVWSESNIEVEDLGVIVQ